MALVLRLLDMAKTYNNLYEKIISLENLIIAHKKARKHKTKKDYVIEFESDLQNNLLQIHKELEYQTYLPEPLKTFILRDPKTRKISKSAFRDRIVHHALIRILEPIFEKSFIYDSCANRIRKGNLFALKRFDQFKRKVSKNNTRECFVLKADVKHYFEEVNHEILLKILGRKIKDEKVLSLIEKILANLPSGQIGGGGERLREKIIPEKISSGVASRTSFCRKGMPLGNLTSQFLANVYLNELDYFVKYRLKAKYYLRYVDDFVILHESKGQLRAWKKEIEIFLRDKLKLELHPQKSKIISFSRGIDFVGFRNFYHHKLLRKRNIRNIFSKIIEYKNGKISKEKMLESFQGWNAYAKWANSFKLRRRIVSKINS